ncbi:hypothetical protein ABZ297_28070 [Nonomuraea sp. NPDC005983]|uniref:galactose-binding domain-containing protein n=1 Tax=Nonomuraea sp. NPDC005983 TaxID=3155595 RepID=UPI0033B71CEC
MVAALVMAPPANSASGPSKPKGQITMAANPAELDLIALPCFSGSFQATMTNTGQQAQFADMTLSAQEPITLSRDIFSSYLPAVDPDQPVSTPVEVRAPRDTPPGTYDVLLAMEKQTLRVPVRVQQPPAKGPGDNLALGEQAFASSTHGNFSVCGGVDGNKNHDQWDTHTGWNDATATVFPDNYGVRFPEPKRIDQVEVLTLDSAKSPAARFGLKDWDVQVLADGQWQTVAQVRGNTSGLATSRFAATTAEAVQIVIYASNDARYSRVMEMEVRGG